MKMNQLTKTQKLTISGVVIALYIVILYFTQSFSFGAYQIRIATALYACGYFCPFLILPLGIANLISNTLFGGLGPLDMIGGCMVGILTTACVVAIKRFHLPKFLVAVPIIFVPGLLIPTYLSGLLGVPYAALSISLCIGQSVPAVCGAAGVYIASKYVSKNIMNKNVC